jgi:hypothetical protein
LAYHAQRILRFPDISIAQDWNALHALLQLADRIPTRFTIVELRRGARVQSDPGTPFFLSYAPRLQICEQLVEFPFELDRIGTTPADCTAARTMFASSFGLHDRCTASAPSHRTGQPKFVDMVDPTFTCESTYCLTDVHGSTP